MQMCYTTQSRIPQVEDTHKTYWEYWEVQEYDIKGGLDT